MDITKGEIIFTLGSLAEIGSVQVLINVNTPPTHIFRDYAILVIGITVALGWLSMCRHRLCRVCDVFLLYERY